MQEAMPTCPNCGHSLKKDRYNRSGWLNLAGALAWALFACWAGAAYALLAVGELCLSIIQFLRRETYYNCEQCKSRFGSDDVKQTITDDGTG
jgi:predicted nucleic acid-binding Zn ribbon protein